MPVGKIDSVKILAVLGRQSALIVHPAAPSAGKIGAVAPCVVLFHPFVIREQRVEYGAKPTDIACGLIMLPFAPFHDFGSGAGGREARIRLSVYLFIKCAADEAVAMLARIKIVERPLKIENAAPYRPNIVMNVESHMKRLPSKAVSMKFDTNPLYASALRRFRNAISHAVL